MYPPRGIHSLVGSQLHEGNLTGQGNLTEQVGGKDERTIEYGQEHGSLAFIVTGYLRSHPAYLPAYLRLGNGHFKLLV